MVHTDHKTIYKKTVSRIVDELSTSAWTDYPCHFLPGKKPPNPDDLRDHSLPRLPLHDVVQLPPELERMTAQTKIYLQDATPGFCYDLLRCDNYIRLPRPSSFISMAHFKNTLCHEMGHWSGLHLRRRKDNYALEEITAETTAAVLCEALGIKGEFGHAAYIAHFTQDIDMLREGMIAAAKASKYLLSLAEGKETI